MTGQEDLATRDYIDEYITWWSENGENWISFISTETLTFSMGEVTAIIRDKDGKIVPQTPSIPNYYLAFRFYRLAQVSDDLFDSYRNMYLAFESFLSLVFPKGNGREIDWIRNSLKQSKTILHLQNLVPSGIPSCIDYIIDTIYEKARLPLFHAKNGKTRLIPAKLNDRKTVAKALKLLTESALDLMDFDHFEIIVFLRGNNANQPKSLFSR